MPIETIFLNNVGIAFSAFAILFEILNCFFLKVHSRCLDYVQWGYFLALITSTSNAVPFSLELEVGSTLIDLPPETKRELCSIGDYTCNRAFALAFLVFISAFLVFMRLMTFISMVNEYGPKFRLIYQFFKGFLKWFSLPLLFQAFSGIFNKEDLAASAIMLIVLTSFPAIQFTFYYLFDSPEDNSMLKWFELYNYGRAFLFALFSALAYYFNSSVYLFFIFGIFIGYSAFSSFYFLKREGEERIKKIGNIIYFAEEGVFLLLLTLYAGRSTWLNTAYLDIPAFALIIFCEILHFILESYRSQNSKMEIPKSLEGSQDGINVLRNGQTSPPLNIVIGKNVTDESFDSDKEKGKNKEEEDSSNIIFHGSTINKARRTSRIK